ncbi:MAG: methanogenesis-associated radical SAM protein, partial [Methanobrevibacter boviskoreani]|nr:methanogenesis-associated radical SAM protein [Methanobrevibacter boviskoreani]
RIFEKIGASDHVNVISTKKDIACLITKYDLEDIDLTNVQDTVFIPGRAYIHELDANRIFSADGIERLVTRGPDTLSVDGELSGTLTEEDVIEQELIQFRELVGEINFYGRDFNGRHENI